MKYYIIANPLQFSDTNMLYINIMSQEESFEVTINKENENDNLQESSFLEQFNQFKENIFNKYFKSSAVKAYSDGFGNFFSEKTHALNSMSQNLTYKKFNNKYKIVINGLSYYYDSWDEAWEHQKVNVESKLVSKVTLNSELIKSTYFNEIKEYNKIAYSIFKVFFNGKYRYFTTYNDALYYMFGNTSIIRKNDTLTYYEVSYKGVLYENEVEFYKWVSENLVVVKGKE
ncbi:hypothetical protein SCLARK_00562 [Spiroplasma clarkii]|uniref:hypothetical protein n=1 Tax=Spiroplasma clarkii TaxID=2139 RepID=UPI000B56F2AA|nr:hypothetical protein [Spiroplasma clarkii]ARU91244.1 hypothetical protein SCLARK_00562 [Spiroplasma clarkii]